MRGREKHTVRRFSPLRTVGTFTHLPFLTIDMLLLSSARSITRRRSLDISGIGVHGNPTADLGNALELGWSPGERDGRS